MNFLIKVFILGMLLVGNAFSQTLPVFTKFGIPEKSYGRASLDFRNIGCTDYWFVGHQRNDDAPYQCNQGSVSEISGTPLPPTQEDGDGADRHGCAFIDLNNDGKVDGICTHGADRGTGTAGIDVLKNISTNNNIQFQRIPGTQHGLAGVTPNGSIGDAAYGRNRAAVFFKWADGTLGLFIMTQGEPRADGKPNKNRLYKYNGNFSFTEVIDPVVTQQHSNECGVVGDLNGDGLDDIVMCRTKEWNLTGGADNASSIIYYQTQQGTFVETIFGSTNSRWVTAEVYDWDGDGKKDLIASIFDTANPKVSVYRQTNNGLSTTPSSTFTTGVVSYSIAVSDLNSDGKPDMYITQSVYTECNKMYQSSLKMTDTWKDIYIKSNASGWTKTILKNEPTTNRCSWLATATPEKTIHLSGGTEGYPGQGYIVSGF